MCRLGWKKNNVEKYILKSLRGLSRMNVDKMVGKRHEIIGLRASGGRVWDKHFKKKKRGNS